MPTLTTPHVTPDFARGVFYCPSSSSPGTVYEAWLATSETGTVRGSCTCSAGRPARHGAPVATAPPVPCRHAVAVCEALKAHGLAERNGKRWVATERAPGGGVTWGPEAEEVLAEAMEVQERLARLIIDLLRLVPA